MENGEVWKCHPIKSDSATFGTPSQTVDKRVHRNCFVLGGVGTDRALGSLLREFATSNAHRLDMQPADLLSRLHRAERLQRRLSQGPQAGTWTPAASVRIFADQHVVDKLVTLGSAVFDLQVHEVVEYTSLPPTCFRCGVLGHLAKFCRGTVRCRACGAQGQHESKNCPHQRSRQEGPTKGNGLSLHSGSPAEQPAFSHAGSLPRRSAGAHGAPPPK